MQISFCSTCHNRAYQLKRVFVHNIAALTQDREAEWIIVNYNSRDDLHQFMLRHAHVCTKRVTYVRELSGRAWHASIAKNIAHRASRGEILVNLDCDNEIGGALAALRAHFNRETHVMHLRSPDVGDGTYGRIAVRRQAFYDIGGYDETLLPMGYQDADLLARLQARGYSIAMQMCSQGVAVQNTKQDSVRHCSARGKTWEHYRAANERTSRANIRVGRLVANTGVLWGVGRLDFPWRDQNVEWRPSASIKLLGPV